MKLIFGTAIMTSPTVPRKDPTPVRTEALSTPRAQGVSADAFGAGIGEGLQRAGGVVSSIVAEERAKADRTAAINSRIAIDEAEQLVTWGTDDKPGFLRKKGKETFDVEEPTFKTFDERMGEIEKGLTTQEQKDAFKQLAAQRKIEIDKQLQRHVYGETKAYAEESNKAALASTLNNVSNYYNDPDRIEQERKLGAAVIASDPENKGKPAGWVKLKQAAWEISVHDAVIERTMVEDPLKAQAYFEKNRDFLFSADANAAAKIEAKLKPLVKDQEVSAAADDIYRSNPDATREDMITALKDKYKGKSWVKDAEAEVRRLHADREDEKKQIIDQAERGVYSYIAKVKLSGRTPKKSDVPPEVWAALAKVDPEGTGKILDELRQGQDQDKERINSKPTVEMITNWGLLKKNPQALKSTNLDKLLGSGKINQKQYEDLLTDQTALSQGKGEHETKILSDKAAMDTVLSAAGIDDKKDPERYMQFYSVLNDRIKIFENENGRKAKQEEIVKLSRGLLTEVSQDVNFWFIDKTKSAFEASPSRVRVPEADRKAITQALTANKQPVTDEAIRAIYLENKKGGN